MIVKCIANSLEVPEKYRALAPSSLAGNQLDVSIDKYYAVYGIRQNFVSGVIWFFVYTDYQFLWWMPEHIFKITDTMYPKNWVKQPTKTGEKTSYPSLHRWDIEEGIIGGDRKAEKTFLAEVVNDPTFPSQDEIDKLNDEFERQKRWKEYQKDLKIAKENGWERPEKPED